MRSQCGIHTYTNDEMRSQCGIHTPSQWIFLVYLGLKSFCSVTTPKIV